VLAAVIRWGELVVGKSASLSKLFPFFIERKNSNKDPLFKKVFSF
jgi:hypothetical protein